MVGSMMYHVESANNSTPFRNYALFTFTTFVCICLMKRPWPRVSFSVFLLFMYSYVAINSIVHGFAQRATFLQYIGLTCSTILPLLTYGFSYHLANILTWKSIERLLALGLLVLAVFYVMNIRMITRNDLIDENMQEGSVYIFLMFLPFVMLFSNKKAQFVGVFLIFAAIVLSLKRGGIITCVLSIVAYYMVSFHVQGKRITGKAKFIFAVTIMAIIVGGLLFMNNIRGGLIYERFASIESDGGSGRNMIYAITLKMIQDSNERDLLFGHGWNFVCQDAPFRMSAHNDYLEAMYDMGFVGFLFLLFLLYNVLLQMGGVIKAKSIYAPAYAASFVIFLVNTQISHVFLYPMYMSVLTMFWGYVAGKENNRNSDKNRYFTKIKKSINHRMNHRSYY